MQDATYHVRTRDHPTKQTDIHTHKIEKTDEPNMTLVGCWYQAETECN